MSIHTTNTHTYTPCLQDRIKLIASQGDKNRHIYVHTHKHTYTHTPCLQDRIKLIAGQGHKTDIHMHIHIHTNTYTPAYKTALADRPSGTQKHLYSPAKDTNIIILFNFECCKCPQTLISLKRIKWNIQFVCLLNTFTCMYYYL